MVIFISRPQIRTVLMDSLLTIRALDHVTHYYQLEQFAKPTQPKLFYAPLLFVTVHIFLGFCKGGMTCLFLLNIPAASELFSPIYFPRKAKNSPSSQIVRSLVLELSSC